MIHSIVGGGRMARGGARALQVAAFGACLALHGCVTAPPPSPAAQAAYTPAGWRDLPGFGRDRASEAVPAFLAGCAALMRRAEQAITWRPACDAARRLPAADDAATLAWLQNHFTPYRVAFPDGRERGLVTGYYEPVIAGSRTRSAAYTVPILAPPDDLLVVDLGALHPELADRRVRGRLDGRRVVPYWSRAEIEAGKAPLAGKALAFVADPVDAFFLQIQGSGRIVLPDGAVMRVGYADQNGHPYTPVARVLIERGEMTREEASMQAIRAWARANPDRVAALLDANASYVFFRELPKPAPGTPEAAIDGPLGALGVPLLPRRTIAVDPRAIPLGAPVWLATREPSGPDPLERLVVAQDTGGAIRGAVRADFFFGHGDDAADRAGRMKEEGRLWLLWPKGAPLPK
jgi:membrane-bound lytic murein transglycosylase A